MPYIGSFSLEDWSWRIGRRCRERAELTKDNTECRASIRLLP